MTGGTGHPDKERIRPLSPCGGIDGGARTLHSPLLHAQPPSSRTAPLFASEDSLFAPEDPFCLSPEDDLRPPAREILYVSLQRMTYGPLRGRPSLSLPTRERTWFRRVGETPALASLPSIGENKRGLPTPGCCDSLLVERCEAGRYGERPFVRPASEFLQGVASCRLFAEALGSKTERHRTYPACIAPACIAPACIAPQSRDRPRFIGLRHERTERKAAECFTEGTAVCSSRHGDVTFQSKRLDVGSPPSVTGRCD